MNAIHYWLNPDRRGYVKVTLLICISYFFLGVSEGTFFFTNGIDTLINFTFTLFCVVLNWRLFKLLHQQSERWFQSAGISILRTVMLILLLSSHTILLNWAYIELLWQENLEETAFFPVVLPLAITLFLLWTIGYRWLQKLALKKTQTTNLPEVTFELRKGKQTVFRSLSQTLGFVVDNKLVFLLSHQREQLLIDKTLNELEFLLEEKGFFRVNRQLLLCRNAIQSYKTIKNERIQVTLPAIPGMPLTCIVSRYKASAFRRWLANPPFSC